MLELTLDMSILGGTPILSVADKFYILCPFLSFVADSSLFFSLFLSCLVLALVLLP